MTALMLAAWKGHGLIAAHLLAHKADVNAQSLPNGYTALHGAVGNGHTLLVSLLVRHNADVGMPDNEGATALDEAANLNSKVYEELQVSLRLPLQAHARMRFRFVAALLRLCCSSASACAHALPFRISMSLNRH